MTYFGFTLEEWKIIIDSGSAFWIACMAFFQTAFLGATLYFGYLQYVQFLEKKFRVHAVKIHKLHLKMINIRYKIIDRFHTELDHLFETDETYLKLPYTLRLVYEGCQMYTSKLKILGPELEKHSIKIQTEISFLGNKEIRKNNFIIQDRFNTIKNKIHYLNNSLDSYANDPGRTEERQKILEDKILDIYLELPEHYQDKRSKDNSLILESEKVIDKELNRYL